MRDADAAGTGQVVVYRDGAAIRTDSGTLAGRVLGEHCGWIYTSHPFGPVHAYRPETGAFDVLLLDGALAVALVKAR